MRSRKIRVLIVDDSRMARTVIHRMLKGSDRIEVVGEAENPYQAKDRIMELKPDVMTLDLEMPRMDGLTFLSIVMDRRPMPVIVVSTLTQMGSAKALEALRRGAFDILAKPEKSSRIAELSDELIQKVMAAGEASLGRLVHAHRPSYSKLSSVEPASSTDTPYDPKKVIALGASTGGTEALGRFLAVMPTTSPPIVIAQHIPARFSGPFARRLNQRSAVHVIEAKDGDLLLPGFALVAPGGKHLVVEGDANRRFVRLTSAPPEHYQRPSVDVLFRSVARSVGPNAVAALLTGMGKDGAKGLLKIRQQGGATIAQDEDSCVVYGMPAAAVALGAVQETVSLDNLSAVVLKNCSVPIKDKESSCRGMYRRLKSEDYLAHVN